MPTLTTVVGLLCVIFVFFAIVGVQVRTSHVTNLPRPCSAKLPSSIRVGVGQYRTERRRSSKPALPFYVLPSGFVLAYAHAATRFLRPVRTRYSYDGIRAGTDVPVNWYQLWQGVMQRRCFEVDSGQRYL
eukprot:3071989-Rhodomonas_salina.1